MFAGLQFPPALPLMSVNRPFYRYSGHIELIRFKEYYGMPRGHKHIPFRGHCCSGSGKVCFGCLTRIRSGLKGRDSPKNGRGILGLHCHAMKKKM